MQSVTLKIQFTNKKSGRPSTTFHLRKETQFKNLINFLRPGKIFRECWNNKKVPRCIRNAIKKRFSLIKLSTEQL